jgi:nicotinate phosphoribosyltransferase
MDSGDLTYLSKKARSMLDAAGLESCKIVASNSLDEYIIQDLLVQGAQIDAFGVGERMITSKSSPVFGGVYKLAAVEDENGTIIPKIKISENPEKVTNPHFKKVYRLYDNESGKAFVDVLCVHDEVIDDSKDLELFDPRYNWKRKTFTNFHSRELMVPILSQGKLVYDLPALPEIQKYCAAQLSLLWDEVKRFENPHAYYVDLSPKLWDIRQQLLTAKGV